MVFDPSDPDIDMDSFQRRDWSYSICSSPGEGLRKHYLPTFLSHLEMASKSVALWTLIIKESL